MSMSHDTPRDLAQLTRRQQDVVRTIAKLERECDSLTSRRLAEELGLARQNLREHLLTLHKLGWVVYEARERHVALVRLTPHARTLLGAGGFPLVGEVAAGAPTHAEQLVERYVTRLEDLLDLRAGDFLLRVRGDSMIGAGIYDGDIVAIRPTETWPLDGEIVLALVPGENTATLKRLYRRGEHVTLLSENTLYTPMTYPAGDVTVQGYLVGHVGASRPRRLA